MKQLHEFETLAKAQEYPVTTPKIINSNEMSMEILKAGVSDEVLDAPQGILRVFAMRINAESNFDFRNETDDGKANQLTLDFVIGTQTDDGLAQRYQILKDNLVKRANKVVYPYENSTQPQFDAAKARFAASGETSATEIYLQGNLQTAESSMFGAGRYRRLRIVPIFDSSPAHDCSITIQLESETLTEGVFAAEPRLIVIQVKSGQEATVETFPNIYRATKLRVKSAKVDLLNTPFKLEIEGSGV